jgi:hypothetical protein
VPVPPPTIVLRTSNTDKALTRDNTYTTPAPQICSQLFELLRYGFEKSSSDYANCLSEVLIIADVEAPTLRNLRSWAKSENSLSWFPNPLVSEISILFGRRLFVTHGGYVGLASKEVKEGDLVTVLMGGDMPFLLRERGEGQQLCFVGEAYVHGLMYEAIDRRGQVGEQLCTTVFTIH